ncbi:MAG: CHASE3 domain-containing protein [Ignavibacteria bacterium]
MEKLINTLQLEKHHVNVLLFIGLLILISVNIVLYMNMRDLINTEKNLGSTFSNFDIIEKMRDDINDAETGIDFYHITGNKQYLQTYRDLSASIDTIYNELRTNNGNDQNRQYFLDTLSVLVRERFQLLNRSLTIHENNKVNQQLYKQINDEGKDINSKIMSTVQAMKSEERKAMDRRTEVTLSKTEFTLYIVAGGTLISIIILIITFVLFRKAAPDNYFNEKARRLTQDELESIVKERTAEISQINIRLYKTIEEYRRTQSALQQSERDYRTLFEQAHDAIVIIEPEKEIILDVNDRACEMYKINKAQFIGLSLKSFSKNVPDGEKHIKLILEKGYDNDFQSVHYRKDGTEMLMEINASVINYKGQTAILCINRDITERILSYIPLPGS